MLAAWSGAALAQQVEVEPMEFYFSLYPEWKLQHFNAPSRAGTDVGTMGTLRNDTTVLSKDASPKAAIDDHQWSNSYIGFRGQARTTAFTVGYDIQGTIDTHGIFFDNIKTRDAFVYADVQGAGRLAYGKMDTTYKEIGDPVRMFGISSGNIVSTARVVSGVGWKAAGETTFNNRVDHMLLWVSPRWGNFNVGVSHSTRPVVTTPHRKPRLAAAGVYWRDGPWYAALATEVHRNWLPVSLAPDAPAPAAASIRNSPLTASSRDQAWRASTSWTQGPWRVGADIARLRYGESDSSALGGKFRSYANYTGQASVEYRWDSWRFGANHARASAGACALSGAIMCSTNGLGGDQTSLGVLLALNDFAGVFALAVHTRNGPAAFYGSSAQGAGTNAYAFGVKLAMK